MGMSVLEILIAFAVLVISIIPLLELMTTTTRGTKLTRDYLVAYNLAQMAFEQVVNHSTLDKTDSFDQVVTIFNTSASQRGPNGCSGVPVSELATSPADPILPGDGLPEFNFETGDPSFSELFKRFSYTLAIQPASGDDTVVSTSSQVNLARVDVNVFWKNLKGECRSLKYAGYITRRRY